MYKFDSSYYPAEWEVSHSLGYEECLDLNLHTWKIIAGNRIIRVYWEDGEMPEDIDAVVIEQARKQLLRII